MLEDGFVMIYGLYDPRSDKLRYIGKTNDFELRLWQHINDAKNGQRTHKSSWIRSLLKINLIPAIKLLGYSTINSWKEDEKAWIEKAKKEGTDLTNLTDGGDGLIGYNHSEETKRKISDHNKRVGKTPPSQKGRKQSPEHIRKRVEARKNKDNYGHSDKVKKKISQNRKGKNMGNTHTLGRKHTKEWKEAQSKRLSGENNPSYGKKGKKLSEETKAKMRAAHKKRNTKSSEMIIETIKGFRIDYQIGVENSGYRVYKASWQTHRNGKLIKTPMSKRRPRWKLQGIYQTLDRAQKSTRQQEQK